MEKLRALAEEARRRGRNGKTGGNETGKARLNREAANSRGPNLNSANTYMYKDNSITKAPLPNAQPPERLDASQGRGGGK